MDSDEDYEPPLTETVSKDDTELIFRSFEKANTKKSTQWALTSWKAWQSSNGELPTLAEVMEMPIDEVDEILAKFITQLTRNTGENYPISSIKGIIFGMQRYAKAYALKNRTEPLHFINNEYHFPKYTKAFREKKKMLKNKLHNTVKNKKAIGISVTQEEALWNQGVFGCHSSQALSDTIFFYVSKIFGFISGTSLRVLKVNHFVFSQDEYGEYVELNKNFAAEELDEALYTRCHGIETQAGTLRHYTDPENPRTFSNLLKFYFENLDKVIKGDSYLFLATKEGLRFGVAPIGKNTLQMKFSKIMRTAKVPGYFTNQSLVQSIPPRLQGKGYNVKTQQIFTPIDHKAICKLLDPPPGIIPTADTTGPKMFLQILPQQASNLLMNQITGIPTGTVQLGNIQPTIAVSGHQLNIPQSSIQTAILNQAGTHLRFTSPSATQTFCTATGNQPEVTGREQTQAQNITQKFLTMKRKSEEVTIDNMNMKSEPASPQHNTSNPYPLFLTQFDQHQVENKSGNNQVETEQDDVPCNIIIKQEPIDYNGDFGNDYQTNNDNNSSSYDNQKESPSHTYNTRKSTYSYAYPKVAEDNTNLETNCTEGIKRKLSVKLIRKSLEESKTKKSRPDESTGDTESVKGLSVSENEKVEHVAEIEYSFVNDLDRKSVKQAISCDDDGQSVFSLSGTNKMGKTVNDLDLNLGDYLPDDCVIRPGDIDLKRIITPDGGKLKIKVKYFTDS